MHVLREADGRWVCCRLNDAVLQCWDPSPEKQHAERDRLLASARLELQPCPAAWTSSAPIALTAAASLAQSGEFSGWPSERAADDWLSLHLLRQGRAVLRLRQPGEHLQYRHAQPSDAVREANADLKSWSSKLPFDDLRQAVADCHDQQVALLREEDPAGDFDWDSNQYRGGFVLLGEARGRYAFLVSVCLPPGDSKPIVRCGSSLLPREPHSSQLSFTVGCSRVIIRWASPMEAESVAPSPIAPPNAATERKATPADASAAVIVGDGDSASAEALGADDLDHLLAPLQQPSTPGPSLAPITAPTPAPAPPPTPAPPPAFRHSPMVLTPVVAVSPTTGRRDFALTEAEVATVPAFLASGDGRRLRVGSFEVAHDDFKNRLCALDGWLNDELVNALVALAPAEPGHAVLESHFFTKALQHGPGAVERWLKTADASVVHIPIHDKARKHWVYAIVHRPTKAIHYFDS